MQIERGILRYLTRASMKATPFASFCTIVPGNLRDPQQRDTPENLFHLVGSLVPRRNLIGLNKRLFATLWGYLKTHPLVRESLIVDINPTLARTSASLVFLAALDGKEVFQRVSQSESVALVLATVAAHNGSRYDDLRDALVANPQVAATTEEAQEYVDALIRIGLLRIRSVVSPHDIDWALPLIRSLEGIRDPHAQAVSRFLIRADSSAHSYSSASSDARQAINEFLRVETATLLQTLALPALPANRLPLYEDCGAPAELQLTRNAPLESTIEALRRFVERRIPFSGQRWALATMRHFFDSHYGARHEAIPLLTFYEDFFREHFKQHLDNERRIKAGERDTNLTKYVLYNPFNLEIIEKFRLTASTWHDVIRDAWSRSPMADELSLDPSLFNDVSHVAPINPEVPRSVSMFCQIFADPDKAGQVRLLVPRGQTYSGFGKFFSRFVQLFPAPAAERLRRTTDYPSGPMLAEIGGETNHNANLHPALLPFYLEYPTGDHSGNDCATLSCADIHVERDSVDAFALCLRHTPTGRRVHTMDLGFQNLLGRPALYQLLTQFAPPSGIGIRLPESLTSDSGSTEPSRAVIEYRPRIVYDGAIVLARRRWLVPQAKYEVAPQF